MGHGGVSSTIATAPVNDLNGGWIHSYRIWSAFLHFFQKIRLAQADFRWIEDPFAGGRTWLAVVTSRRQDLGISSEKIQGAPMSSSSAYSAMKGGVGLTSGAHWGRAGPGSELRPPGVPIGLLGSAPRQVHRSVAQRPSS